MNRQLVQMFNIRISYPDKEILLFDDNASGKCSHVKLQPQVVASHAYSFVQNLCIPIGSLFGDNVIPQNWEVLAQYSCKKVENLQSSPNLKNIVKEKCSHRPCATSKRRRQITQPHSLGDSLQDKQRCYHKCQTGTRPE